LAFNNLTNGCHNRFRSFVHLVTLATKIAASYSRHLYTDRQTHTWTNSLQSKLLKEKPAHQLCTATLQNKSRINNTLNLSLRSGFSITDLRQLSLIYKSSYVFISSISFTQSDWATVYFSLILIEIRY